MKTKKIIKALKFVKKYCGERDCFDCHFGNSGRCSFTDCNGDLPEGWNMEIIKDNLKNVERINIYD